jgi:hypothetical protein
MTVCDGVILSEGIQPGTIRQSQAGIAPASRRHRHECRCRKDAEAATSYLPVCPVFRQVVIQ